MALDDSAPSTCRYQELAQRRRRCDLQGWEARFRPHHARNDEDEACHAEYIGRFAEGRHADDDRTHGSDSGPHGIGGPKRDGLQREREQAEAQRDGRDHGYARPEPGEAIGVFETEGPRDLQQSSEQKCEPSIERIGCLHHRPRQPLLILRSGAALVMVIMASSQEWLVESHESMGSRITSR